METVVEIDWTPDKERVWVVARFLDGDMVLDTSVTYPTDIVLGECDCEYEQE